MPYNRYMVRKIEIFSFFHNCKQVFTDKKEISLDRLVNVVHFNRQSRFIMSKCNKVVQGINNNHYSFYNYKQYVLNLYMFNKKVSWGMVIPNDIAKIKKLFSNERYKKDKQFVENLVVRLKSDASKKFNVYNMYDVNSNGNNILLDLISSGEISPMYYLMNYQKVKENVNSTKYEASDNLSRLNETTEKINNILRS